MIGESGAITWVLIDNEAEGVMRRWPEDVKEHAPQLEFVGAATNAEDGISLVEDVHPNVVLLDLGLPKRRKTGLKDPELIHGVWCAQEIRRSTNGTDVNILLISNYEPNAEKPEWHLIVGEFEQVGVCGLLSKDDPFPLVARALERAAQGLPAWESAALLKEWRACAQPLSDPCLDNVHLSPRQHEALVIFGRQALGYEELAEELMARDRRHGRHDSRIGRDGVSALFEQAWQRLVDSREVDPREDERMDRFQMLHWVKDHCPRVKYQQYFSTF